MADRFKFTTTLEGFINALQPGGKFNNCTIGFTIPAATLVEFEDAYKRALEWGTAKMAGKRHTQELPKWDDAGFVKISYGGPETSHPMFPWVDTQGVPVPLDTDVRAGTVVNLIVDTKPYVYGNKAGLSLKVRGAQIVKLASGNGGDSGELSAEDVAALFGTTDGFKSGAPSFEPSQAAVEAAGSVADDDDLPF
jgi:hypothetical protein